MSEQLGLLPGAKIGVGERDDVCRCGHSRDHHVSGRGLCMYGLGTRFGQCDCKKHKSKKRAPMVIAHNFTPPQGAVEWFRGPPELVRRKPGGWFLGAPHSLLVYMALSKSSKIESLNVHAGPSTSKATMARLYAAAGNRRKVHAYRIVAALEQAHKHLGAVLGSRPSKTTIVRVSSGRLDDDNLIGACKGVRDGIAEALGFDDELFSVVGAEPGKLPIFYTQAKPGECGVFACQVELKWGGNRECI
jgi:hypothetical protein